MFVAGETSLLIDKGVVFPYKLLLRHTLSGRNSAVECQLPKLDVTGSIPVARSKFFPAKRQAVRIVQNIQTGLLQDANDVLNGLNFLNDRSLRVETFGEIK